VWSRRIASKFRIRSSSARTIPAKTTTLGAGAVSTRLPGGGAAGYDSSSVVVRADSSIPTAGPERTPVAIIAANTTARTATPPVTKPNRRFPIALLAGFVWGALFIGFVVLVAGAWLLVTGLPSDPMGIESYRSAADSRLEAADGQIMAEFPLVESVEPLRIDSTLLVEAYLAMQPGAFYEARVDRTLPVLPVVFGALRGERLLASPSPGRSPTPSRPPKIEACFATSASICWRRGSTRLLNSTNERRRTCRRSRCAMDIAGSSRPFAAA
jgi:hypothetical protein